MTRPGTSRDDGRVTVSGSEYLQLDTPPDTSGRFSHEPSERMSAVKPYLPAAYATTGLPGPTGRCVHRRARCAASRQREPSSRARHLVHDAFVRGPTRTTELGTPTYDAVGTVHRILSTGLAQASETGTGWGHSSPDESRGLSGPIAVSDDLGFGEMMCPCKLQTALARLTTLISWTPVSPLYNSIVMAASWCWR